MEDKRLTRADYFINSALLVSMRASCRRMAVGAVIVLDNRIISTGYNGPAKGLVCSTKCDLTQSCNHAIHAEANAIYFAAKKGINLEGAILYCTHSPCKKCAEAILQVGIKEVNFLRVYRSTEGLKFLDDLGVRCNDMSKLTLNLIINGPQV